MGRTLALVPITIAIIVPSELAPALVVLIGRAIGQYRPFRVVRLAGLRMCAGRFGTRSIHDTIVAGVIGWGWSVGTGSGSATRRTSR